MARAWVVTGETAGRCGLLELGAAHHGGFDAGDMGPASRAVKFAAAGPPSIPAGGGEMKTGVAIRRPQFFPTDGQQQTMGKFHRSRR